MTEPAGPVHQPAVPAPMATPPVTPSVINGGATALIADMTATIWFDRAGADAVVCAFRRAVVGGTQLRLVVPVGHVSRVLSLGGLDHVVPSYPSLEGATAASPPAAARTARARLASVSAEAVAMGRRVGDRGVLAHVLAETDADGTKRAHAAAAASGRTRVPHCLGPRAGHNWIGNKSWRQEGCPDRYCWKRWPKRSKPRAPSTPNCLPPFSGSRELSVNSRTG